LVFGKKIINLQKFFYMKVETIDIDTLNIVECELETSALSVLRPGIAKIIWRELDITVPPSVVIPNGVNLFSEQLWEQ